MDEVKAPCSPENTLFLPWSKTHVFSALSISSQWQVQKIKKSCSPNHTAWLHHFLQFCWFRVESLRLSQTQCVITVCSPAQTNHTQREKIQQGSSGQDTMSVAPSILKDAMMTALKELEHKPVCCCKIWIWSLQWHHWLINESSFSLVSLPISAWQALSSKKGGGKAL